MIKPLWFVLLLTLLGAGAWAQSRADVERSLKSEYQGKVLIQKQFLSGTRLRYADTGLAAVADTGPWTTDGEIRVLRVRLPDDHTIEIQGERQFLGYDPVTRNFVDALSLEAPKPQLSEKQMQDLQERRRVVIDITSDNTFDQTKARATSQESS